MNFYSQVYIFHLYNFYKSKIVYKNQSKMIDYQIKLLIILKNKKLVFPQKDISKILKQY
jgi:hypothetical protein